MVNKEIVFPVLMQSLSCNQVVKFDSLNSGTVVIRGDHTCNDNVGSHSVYYIACTNEEVWKHYIEAEVDNYTILSRLEELNQEIVDLREQAVYIQNQTLKALSEYEALKQRLVDNI